MILCILDPESKSALSFFIRWVPFSEIFAHKPYAILSKVSILFSDCNIMYFAAKVKTSDWAVFQKQPSFWHLCVSSRINITQSFRSHYFWRFSWNNVFRPKVKNTDESFEMWQAKSLLSNSPICAFYFGPEINYSTKMDKNNDFWRHRIVFIRSNTQKWQKRVILKNDSFGGFNFAPKIHNLTAAERNKDVWNNWIGFMLEKVRKIASSERGPVHWGWLCWTQNTWSHGISRRECLLILLHQVHPVK